jgi:hypothetical protein
MHLGAASLTHDIENGFILKGFYRGSEYVIQRKPIQSYNLHVEYSYSLIKGKRDCVVLSTEDDLFYCVPKKENVVTKLAFATQIMFEIYEAEALKSRLERRKLKEITK